MKKFFSLLLFFLLIGTAFSQRDTSGFIKKINEQDCRNQLEKLRAEFGKNKKYDEEWELPILAALTFYPELKETRIHFKKALITTSLQARPKWYFFLKRKKNRPYWILANSDEKNPVNPHKSSFNARVGFLAHELAHITEYEKVNNWGVFKIAYKYAFDLKFGQDFENRADLIVIEHGAGYLKYEASCFVFYKSGAPEEYIEQKRKYYFTPEKILEMTNLAENMRKAKGNVSKFFKFDEEDDF